MKGSHHVNSNSLIFRKGAIHKTEIEAFSEAKDFNTNLVHFLPLHYVIISNLHVCSFTCSTSRMHGRAPKTVLHAQNLVYEKL